MEEEEEALEVLAGVDIHEIIRELTVKQGLINKATNYFYNLNTYAVYLADSEEQSAYEDENFWDARLTMHERELEKLEVRIGEAGSYKAKAKIIIKEYWRRLECLIARKKKL
jgi:hypothetical protein